MTHTTPDRFDLFHELTIFQVQKKREDYTICLYRQIVMIDKTTTYYLVIGIDINFSIKFGFS